MGIKSAALIDHYPSFCHFTPPNISQSLQGLNRRKCTMRYFRQFVAPLTAAFTFSTLLLVNQKCYAVAIPYSLLNPPSSVAQLGPLPDNHSPDTTVVKRGKVPSVDYIVTLIQNGHQMVFEKDGMEFSKVSIFWTSWSAGSTISGYRAALTFGDERAGDHFVIYGRSLTHADYIYFHQGVHLKTPPDTRREADLKIQVLSSAFSRMSAGTVYVLLQDGNDFHEDTVWEKFEMPCLTRTSAVTEIRLIRWPSRTETIIWQRAQGDRPVGVWPPPGADPDIFDSKFF
ncbi:hypothetical protein P154DRAFT_597582 [Amniculicola lignicola CBS 123094]|uniref:Uncharacterized protein n=1 Tax=Amniculicola lignicola CBS 123094 TaxID=1392246 RepID=A0A6A5WZH1_9PLEO|nr:hypothetical protein P154DRAFT_597582 [Amniculicola lignicola CBS 123094]